LSGSQPKASGSAGGYLLVAFLTELARWSGRGDCHTQEDDITLIALDFEQIPIA
jgi:hypothetical protein